MEAGKARGMRTVVGTWLGVMATLGSYGLLPILLLPLVQAYGINVGEASLIFTFAGAGSLVTTFWVGNFFEKVHPKVSYLLASFCVIAFYLTIAFNTNLIVLYAMAVVFGVGSILGGYVAAQMLMTKWVNRGRAKMLSVPTMFMSIFVIVTSPLITALIVSIGFSGTVLAIGCTCAGINLIVALVFVSRFPSYYGLEPINIGKEKPVTEKTSSDIKDMDTQLPISRILKMPITYLALVCSFLLTAIAMLYGSNSIPISMTMGLTEMEGSIVFSIFKFSQFTFVFIFGVLCDRIGPKISIVAFCGLGALILFANGLMTGWVGSIAVAIAVAFAQMSGLYGAVMLPKVFGIKNSSKLISYSHTLASIGAMAGPPLAGFIYIGTGSYLISLMIGGGLFVLTLLSTIVVGSKKTKENITAKDKQYLKETAASNETA